MKSKHPKEEAVRIINLFELKVKDLDNEISLTKHEAIQCASICVDEIINSEPGYVHIIYDTVTPIKEIRSLIPYYEEVKEHINKMVVMNKEKQERANAETVLLLETCCLDNVILEKNPRLKENILDAMISYAQQQVQGKPKT